MKSLLPPVALLGLTLVAATAPRAAAVEVRVTVAGTVDFNQIQGNQANVAGGDPVTMSFSVDSDSFVDSPNFPVRGYALDPASFQLSVGGNPIPFADPQPFGPAYFVLRDNDPAVDGFFLSRNIDVPQPVSVNIPGLTQVHELNFSRTFNDGAPLPSLDILDALGTYGTENLSVFDWSVGLFGNAGGSYNYESITLAAVPEPASLGFVGVAGLALLRRRRA